MTNQGSGSQMNTPKPSLGEAESAPWVMTGFTTTVDLSAYAPGAFEVTKKKLEQDRIKQLKSKKSTKVFQYSADFPSTEASSGEVVSGDRDIDRMFMEEELGAAVQTPSPEGASAEYFDAEGLFSTRPHEISDPALKKMEVALHVAHALQENPEDYSRIKIPKWDMAPGPWSIMNRARLRARTAIKGKAPSQSAMSSSPEYHPQSPSSEFLDPGPGHDSGSDSSYSFLSPSEISDFQAQELAQQESFVMHEIEQIARSMQAIARNENWNLELSEALSMAKQQLEEQQHIVQQTIADTPISEQSGPSRVVTFSPQVPSVVDSNDIETEPDPMVGLEATANTGVVVQPPQRKSSLPIPKPPIVEVPMIDRGKHKQPTKSKSLPVVGVKSWNSRLRSHSVKDKR